MYEAFSGHTADNVDVVNVPEMKEGLTVGKCLGIMYTTVRDGVRENYLHEFKHSARPELVASYDGSQLGLIGGKFRFTDAGITDD